MPKKEYGYEYDAILNVQLYQETQGRTTENKIFDAFCFRSGRDCLKAIAREYQPTTVFLPALSCDSMSNPFIMYHHDIRYYPLAENLSIDIDGFMYYVNNIKMPCIFLYMDYFGNQIISDDDLRKLKAIYPSMIFIEDITHNLIQGSSHLFMPDYKIASLRKWINVPDGGLLWTSRELHNIHFGNDMSFFEKRLRAQCMRNDYLLHGGSNIKSEYRTVFSSVSNIIDNDPVPGRMSEYSYQMTYITDWNSIKEKRINNAKALASILSISPNIHLIQDKQKNSSLYVPFIINNRGEVQNKLSSINIYNTII